MTRIITAVFVFLVVMLVSILGFRGSKSRKEPLYLFPDMDRQAKYYPQGENTFFEDGMNDRLPPMNVIPRGNALDRAGVFSQDYSADRLRNVKLLTGKDSGGNWVSGFPVEVSNQTMLLGQQKFEIFCSACHGYAGDGNGAVRNFPPPTLAPANLMNELFRNQTEGEIFNTITYGKNTMSAYGDKLTPEERWAVILYVRALQRAGSASIDDIPDSQRKELGL